MRTRRVKQSRLGNGAFPSRHCERAAHCRAKQSRRQREAFARLPLSTT
ncbi:MAG: hypothetical protein LBT00_14255 [Spirochaetaceae bacterium]|nr:hypothetical protein [Spirochaetaceae bacterium]